MEQPVRVERVAAAHPVEAELEPFAGRSLGHLRVELACPVDAQAVLAGEVLIVVAGALCGRMRVELERAVGDGDVVSVLELLERLLEPALADVAPRADDVRPDLNLHVRHNTWRVRTFRGDCR